jgi:exodeoxyribonuclease VII large subunit
MMADGVVLRVGDVVAYLKALLDSDTVLGDLWVRGEVSNLSRSGAGHTYFTLKDEVGQLRCVMFRGSSLGTQDLQQGTRALVHGRVSLYEVQGGLQLYADFVQAEGVGSLHQRFEELKGRLAAEGLFDDERKRPLPPFPRRIGVVTSPQAAALQDVLRVLAARFPAVEVVLAPCLVQGEGAPAQIVAAIRRLDGARAVDVILVVRGGGALEELWAFNDEDVARAIASCGTPVVTGVGHETDCTIADLAADVRLPTPSAAAAAIVPDWRECAADVEAVRLALRDRMVDVISSARRGVADAQRALALLSPIGRVRSYRQQVDDTVSALQAEMLHVLGLRRARVDASVAQLAALNPHAILQRGYALVTNLWGEVVRDAAQVTPGELLDVHVYRGAFGVTVSSPPQSAISNRLVADG